MFKIYINDEEVVCANELTITDELTTPSSVILNNVYPKTWEDDQDYVSNFYYPKEYSICNIYQDEILKFSGIVKNTGNISLNPREAHFCSVQVISFDTFLSQCDTLDYVINNKTINQAIDMIIESVADYKFVKGNIAITNKDTDRIIAYSCLDKTPYDVFNYIKDITNTLWFTRPLDDGTIAIDFYEKNALTVSKPIEYTQKYFEDNNIVDISFNYGTYDYRNKQIIKSQQIMSEQIQKESVTVRTFGQDEFILNYGVGRIVSIKTSVYGDSTFASQTAKENGVSAEFYYEWGSNTIEHNSEYSDLQNGIEIDISYYPVVYGREIVYNTSEVERIASLTGRKGVISRFEDRDDSISSKELNKIAQSYILYKGTPEINLTIKTKDKDLFDIGHYVDFQTDSKVPNELETSYMVKKKEINMIIVKNVQHIFYTYELCSNFNAEADINYFDNQRAKRGGNINEGEFITRNVDIENTANIIFKDLTVSEVTPIGDNVLDCILDAPFIK